MSWVFLQSKKYLNYETNILLPLVLIALSQALKINLPSAEMWTHASLFKSDQRLPPNQVFKPIRAHCVTETGFKRWQFWPLGPVQGIHVPHLAWLQGRGLNDWKYRRWSIPRAFARNLRNCFWSWDSTIRNFDSRPQTRSCLSFDSVQDLARDHCDTNRTSSILLCSRGCLK